jgi:hypothetical protein
MKITIRIKGLLDKKWEDWFDLNIKHEAESTVISGEIQDEAALHGILNQIRDLNLKLVSVTPLENESDKT